MNSFKKYILKAATSMTLAIAMTAGTGLTGITAFAAEPVQVDTEESAEKGGLLKDLWDAFWGNTDDTDDNSNTDNSNNDNSNSDNSNNDNSNNDNSNNDNSNTDNSDIDYYFDDSDDYYDTDDLDKEPEVKVIPLQKISLSKKTLTMYKGTTKKLKVKYTPANTTVKKKVTWKSSNKKIAIVKNGTIVPKRSGKVTITATVNGKKASCKVTIKKKTATKKKTTGSNKKKTTDSNSNSNSNKNTNTNTNTNSNTNSSNYPNVNDAYTYLNTFRTTKSNQWYWNSDNKTKTYTYNLKALTKDSKLEAIAKTRAKEQWTQYYVNGKITHDRPNGQQWYTAYTNVNVRGENLAWGYSTSKSVIDAWAETNEGYSGQGHRRNMLSSSARKVGIACYTKDGKTCWAMCTAY